MLKTKKKRHLSLRRICGLLEIPLATAERWASERLIPFARGNCVGRGQSRELDLRGVMTICLIAALSRQGANWRTMRPATDWLAATDPESIADALREGRTVLHWAGDALPPTLLAPEKIVHNRSGEMLMLASVDMERLWSMAAGTLAAAIKPENA